ncbi:MAG: fold metallo-hydrolase [Ilumatobacteraceae bacterium]|nr:fold metallo-hydrolase [Ilumatobacteraceae bacterium]
MHVEIDALPRIDGWFERLAVDDGITLLWEPHVVPLMRCNIWHVRGRDRSLVIDTGMGLVSLVDAAADLFGGAVSAVATHGHDDHIGNHHEFAETIVHPLEADLLRDPPLRTLDPVEAWGADALDDLRRMGYAMDEPYFVSALPVGFVVETYRQRPARVGRLVDEGDVIDIGDRHFEVLHLPGHSPGSIGLWESVTGTLFSGDAIYDGALLDELPESDIAAYCRTMERLLGLPVTVVHAGHDPSFGRARLRELARAYLDRRS